MRGVCWHPFAERWRAPCHCDLRLTVLGLSLARQLLGVQGQCGLGVLV